MDTQHRLTDSIISLGREQAETVAAEACKQAQEILAQGEQRAASAADAILQEAQRKAKAMRTAAPNNAESARRSEVLRVKRAEIGKTVDGVRAHLLALDDAAYFERLYHIAGRLRGKSGELCLNARDLARLPADFSEKMQAVGVTATVCATPADISGGFILCCGQIEYSCAIEALIEEYRNALEDDINTALFAE